MLANNIDVMLQDSKGQTAMHLACITGDVGSYKALATHNYMIKNCVDHSKKTPLDYAVEKKHQAIIDLEKSLTVTLYSKTKTNAKVTPDDFEYIMPLGRGAFGEVILVRHKSEEVATKDGKDDGKYFAMKIMKKRKYSGMLNFVLTEKEVSRKVRHRFIVRLAYAFQTFDKLFMVTEFCSGGDMRALINMRGKKGLPEAEAKLYLAEILVAIEELHKNGIIHRDIKPENILLDKDGHCKLTDFGLSKEGMFEKKQTNTFLGGGRSY